MGSSLSESSNDFLLQARLKGTQGAIKLLRDDETILSSTIVPFDTIDYVELVKKSAINVAGETSKIIKAAAISEIKLDHEKARKTLPAATLAPHLSSSVEEGENADRIRIPEEFTTSPTVAELAHLT